VALRSRKRRLAAVGALAAVSLGTGGLEMYGRFGAGADFDTAHAALPSRHLASAVSAVGMKLSDFFAAVGIIRAAPARPDKLILKGKGAVAPKAFTAAIPPAAAEPEPDIMPPMAFSAVAPGEVVPDPLPAALGDPPPAPPFNPNIAPPDLPPIGPPPPPSNPPVTPPTSPVPEPGTWLLMVGGIGLIGAQLRRRSRHEIRRARTDIC